MKQQIELNYDIDFAIENLKKSSYDPEFWKDKGKTNFQIGIVAFDGKSALPDELSKVIKVISPKTTMINIYDGLTPEQIMSTVKKQFGSKTQHQNSHFENGGANIWLYGRYLHQALLEVGATELPNGPINTSGSSYHRAMACMGEKVTEGGHPILYLLQNHPKINQTGTMLNDAAQYLIHLINMEEKERSYFVSSANGWVMELMKSEGMRPWFECLKSEYQLIRLLYGDKVGFSLPESVYGTAGVAGTCFLKAQTYNMIQNPELRGNEWAEKGQAQLFVIADECHRILDAADENMPDIGRSLGCSFIGLTQQIESIEDALGNDTKAKKFLNVLGSRICYKSSPATYRFMQEKIGKDFVIIKKSTAQTIDQQSTAALHMASPYFDSTNPYSGEMDKISGTGWLHKHFFNNPIFDWKRKKGQGPTAAIVDQTNINGFAVSTLSQEPQYLVSDADLQKLNESFVALCDYKRGGASRHAFAKMIPYGNDLRPFSTNPQDKLDDLAKEFNNKNNEEN